MIDVEQTKYENAIAVPPAKWFGVRHVQFVLLFVATIVAYGIRTNLSVGIIAMMDPNPPDPSIPTYPNWTQKDTMLSSFFWGYVVFQIGAGQLSKNFGPKWFLTGTMLINCLFTLLIPPLASAMGESGVILCRVMQGLSQGFLFPSVHNLLGKWAPLSERSRVAGFVYTGGPLGTVLSLPITGLMANAKIGWPSAFYLYGACGVVWVVFWVWLGADSPSQHSSITDVEKRYIEFGTMGDDHAKNIPTPWKSIFTSMPFYAVLLAHIGHNWGYWTLLTEIPSYMSKIMKYDIKSNSLLSALPYFALWLANLVFSPIADFLIVRGYLSIGNTRKLFNTIGVILPALSLIWLGFIDSSQKNLALGLLTAAVGFNAGVFSGFNVNHIDLSPNHAGTLMGLTNSVSNVFSIVAPLALTLTGRSDDDPINWRIVFCITAAFYIVTNVFFVIFCSGKVQSWNDASEPSSRKSKQIA